MRRHRKTAIENHSRVIYLFVRHPNLNSHLSIRGYILEYLALIGDILSKHFDDLTILWKNISRSFRFFTILRPLLLKPVVELLLMACISASFFACTSVCISVII